MATVKIDRFGGISPRVHPTLLSDGMATEAHNLRFKNGKLCPLKEPSYMDPAGHTLFCEDGMASIADAKSVYCWKHTLRDGTVRTDFLAFPGVVTFARGNIADDRYDRVFVTGETGLSWTDKRGETFFDTPAAYMFDRDTGDVIRHPLMKDPPDAVRATFTGEVSQDNAEAAFFFVTWVDEYGYESGCSDQSLNRNTETGEDSSYSSEDPIYLPSSGGRVTFAPVIVPSGAAAMRLYKTVDLGDENGSIQFVREYGKAEIESFISGFSVDLNDAQTQETMPEMQAPPIDLRSMRYVPGAFYAGFSPSMPHTVMFSDVDLPTSWPVAYRYDIKDNIVELAVTSNSVFALTDGTPYVMSGTAPEGMVTSSLANPAACVSDRSVCVYLNQVFFASNYGLYTIGNSASEGTVCKCVTESYFTKEQWQSLNPSSCIMGAYDGALHLFFTAPDGGVYDASCPAFARGRSHVGLILDMTESPFAITTHDEVATCLCTDDRTDDMYFVRDTGGI